MFSNRKRQPPQNNKRGRGAFSKSYNLYKIILFKNYLKTIMEKSRSLSDKGNVDYDSLIDYVKVHHYQAGQILIEQGCKIENFYIIAEGTLKYLQSDKLLVESSGTWGEEFLDDNSDLGRKVPEAVLIATDTVIAEIPFFVLKSHISNESKSVS